MNVERARIVWIPQDDAAEKTQLGQFAAAHGFGSDEYDALHRWSIAKPVDFWSAVWDHAGLLGNKGNKGMVDSAEMGKRHFFPNGAINVAENLLRHDPDSIAIVQMTPEGDIEKCLTYTELKKQVQCVAGWMAKRGVTVGSVVAAIATNRTETVVSMLAAAALGAIWTAASPDLSAQAIIDRFGQVGPVVVFASVRYTYNHKEFDISETLRQTVLNIPSIKHVVLIGQDTAGDQLQLGQVSVALWKEAQRGLPLDGFVRHPFNSPFLIMYTSGTTGKPKAIVHSGGGVLLRTCGEHRLQIGLTPSDTFLWYSSIAWMMFPWLVMALETGATIVLYEDAAIKKSAESMDMGVLWRIAQNAQLTAIGLSPNYLRILQRSDYRPNREFDFPALRSMFTSGAPMPAELYEWCQENIQPGLRINSISGGTEAMSAFVTGSPLHVVRAGEICAKSLGIAVEVYDERGAPIVGQPGELVITQPFPSMPLTFWGPGGDQRYKAAYFDGFPGIWTHGDLAEQTVSGGFLIHGRSDNTLKPGGVRIGTAEIYTALEGIEEVVDAVIFGWVENDDEQIVMCVQLEPGASMSKALASKIRTTIRTQTSSRHVPAKVYVVSDVPKTLNGKRNEAAAKAAALGKDTSRFVSLANRACLEDYAAISNNTFY